MFYLVQYFETFPPSHKHTKLFVFQFNIFTSCTSTLLYIHTHNPSCHPMSNTQMYINQKQCYIPSIFPQHLPSSNIVVSYNPNLYELATTKEGDWHFILSDRDNYDFDIKIGHCKLVGFVKAVIECRCLGYIFCLHKTL